MFYSKGRLIAFAAAAALPSLCWAGSTTYQTSFTELNNSGVTGTAHLVLNNNGSSGTNTLQVTIDATGLEAGQGHAQHIHGFLNGTDATTPTSAQDANGDGYISLLEGQTTYGPIKVNLTSPQTPFGPPAIPAIMAPFAGMPNNADFPVADSSGAIHYSQTIMFDMSKSADADAFNAIKNLADQEIVLHGMTAPNTVDGAALGITNPNGDMIYDPVLPVASGELTQVSAVPLPAAAWMGLSTLAGLAGISLLRKRAAA